MNRFAQSAEHLRDRLRDTTSGAGVIARINRDEVELHADIAIVQVDLAKVVRDVNEFILDVDDAAFLVGVDVWPTEPLPGDEIVTGSDASVVRYRVTERNELQTTWRWHDRGRTQRVVFCKEF